MWRWANLHAFPQTAWPSPTTLETGLIKLFPNSHWLHSSLPGTQCLTRHCDCSIFHSVSYSHISFLTRSYPSELGILRNLKSISIFMKIAAFFFSAQRSGRAIKNDTQARHSGCWGGVYWLGPDQVSSSHVVSWTPSAFFLKPRYFFLFPSTCVSPGLLVGREGGLRAHFVHPRAFRLSEAGPPGPLKNGLTTRLMLTLFSLRASPRNAVAAMPLPPLAANR